MDKIVLIKKKPPDYVKFIKHNQKYICFINDLDIYNEILLLYDGIDLTNIGFSTNGKEIYIKL